MTLILAFPFRIDPETGDAATVAQGSDGETATVIAMLAHTRLGERDLCPGFGTSDPAYVPTSELVQEIQAGLALFGPQVTVQASSVTVDPSATAATINLTFTAQQEEPS